MPDMPDTPALRFVWDRANRTPLENRLIELLLAMFLTNRLLGRQQRKEEALTSEDSSAAVQETIAWVNRLFPELHVTQNLSS